MDIAPPFVLIDDAHAANGGAEGAPETVMRLYTARLYTAPHKIIACTHPADVADALAAIDRALADGFHVAGYMAYELGYLLEAKLAALLPDTLDGPLIWMGVFSAPRLLDQRAAAQLMDAWAAQGHTVSPPEAALTRERYMAHVETVREHIRAGDVYQINYTFPLRFTLTGSALSLYAQLRERQRATYGAVIHTGAQHILSLSPELFVAVKDDVAHTRPMKGTAARAASPHDDAARRHWLGHDEKSRAENLMIVDLLRNDLGRIAEIGSVKVSDLFSVETYPTLHQMTSGVRARLRAGTAFSDVLKALFPCGSVTGAPKVKAMEIIRTLEDEPRGVYTGAIGYASNADGLCFNVAIRTLSVGGDDQGQGHGKMGIGSGIVYDSHAADEWDECHLKARFLTAAQAPFALLETLRWDRETGFALLARHLDRLAASAAYFCFSYDADQVQRALDAAVAPYATGHAPAQVQAQRVRLTVDARGAVEVELQPLTPLSADGELTFVVSDAYVDSASPFTYHKTTNRAFYDDARHGVAADEVLFLNARGELTEGSFTTVFVEKNGQLLTPPIACGLLAGTLRQDFLDRGQARESILTRADLAPPNRVFLGNSVRGLMPARPL